ncbi:YbaK/EbsC family protein [Candidatus Pacearchaeota archaeon]|nr:YbaK/EbsC family protein [Candidatus Pacearchaeota archaeon]
MQKYSFRNDYSEGTHLSILKSLSESNLIQEEVMEKTGCQIGAVPPFGHKDSIPILVDKGVYNNKESAFNIGLRTNSVKIPTQEMSVVFKDINAIEGDFVKI